MHGALTLILETSTPAASLAMMAPDGSFQEREFFSDRSHNALMFSPLRELLATRNGRRIGLVLVGSGPGSYSGTRVGIAAAQGVAIACGCPAVAVPSILAVPAAEGGAACLAIGDARRGSFWIARVEDYHLAGEPELVEASGLESAVADAAKHGMPVFSFEAAARYPLPPGLLERIRVEIPAASRLWRIWERASEELRAFWAAAVPQPMYLKPPHITPAKRAARR